MSGGEIASFNMWEVDVVSSTSYDKHVVWRLGAARAAGAARAQLVAAPEAHAPPKAK